MSNIEVIINGLSRIAQIDSDEHSITFLLSLKKRDDRDAVTMHLSGYNKDTNQDLKWFDEQVAKGSEIKILISEEKRSISEPIEIKEFPDTFIDEQKLKTYKFLKEELSSKGLI